MTVLLRGPTIGPELEQHAETLCPGLVSSRIYIRTLPFLTLLEITSKKINSPCTQILALKFFQKRLEAGGQEIMRRLSKYK